MALKSYDYWGIPECSRIFLVLCYCPLGWGFYTNSTSAPELPRISEVCAKMHVFYGVIVACRLNDPLDDRQV